MTWKPFKLKTWVGNCKSWSFMIFLNGSEKRTHRRVIKRLSYSLGRAAVLGAQGPKNGGCWPCGHFKGSGFGRCTGHLWSACDGRRSISGSCTCGHCRPGYPQKPGRWSLQMLEVQHDLPWFTQKFDMYISYWSDIWHLDDFCSWQVLPSMRSWQTLGRRNGCRNRWSFVAAPTLQALRKHNISCF